MLHLDSPVAQRVGPRAAQVPRIAAPGKGGGGTFGKPAPLWSTLKLMTRERFDVPPLAMSARWPRLITAAARAYNKRVPSPQSEASKGQSVPDSASLPPRQRLLIAAAYRRTTAEPNAAPRNGTTPVRKQVGSCGLRGVAAMCCRRPRTEQRMCDYESLTSR